MNKYKRYLSLGMMSLALGGACRLSFLHGVISADVVDGLQGCFIGMGIGFKVLAARHRGSSGTQSAH